MIANDILRSPPGVLVHVIVPAASHRRIVWVHTPVIDAAMPILTHDVMMPCTIQDRPINRDIIHAMSNIAQLNSNCLVTL
ncbi:MAG TPA: hypothetical protein VKM55_00145 [Candidatus Lokiarchaeia archaeon]|nr:hypothetical protein [Candidatus Lokiarchaeia archaeon]